MSTPDEILRGLDPEQRRAATALQGPVCILAGAGTGKTRAITHRIAYGVASGVFDPHRTLALTFTARAAAEMRTRLRDLGVAGVVEIRGQDQPVAPGGHGRVGDPVDVGVDGGRGELGGPGQQVPGGQGRGGGRVREHRRLERGDLVLGHGP